tara:strand:- start:234 stop:461 length:228 start_codon:yes stop_codon:yes gene_type:complete
MLFSKEDSDTFIKEVEQHASKNDQSYIDATLAVCDKYEIEPLMIAKILPKPIVEKIEQEGMSLNILPKNSSQLPV